MKKVCFHTCNAASSNEFVCPIWISSQSSKPINEVRAKFLQSGPNCFATSAKTEEFGSLREPALKWDFKKQGCSYLCQSDEKAVQVAWVRLSMIFDEKL